MAAPRTLLLTLGLLAAMVPMSEPVLSGMRLRLLRIIGPDQLHGFTPARGINSDLGGVGHLRRDVSSDLGGIGGVTNIGHFHEADFDKIGSLGGKRKKLCSHPETFLPGVTGMLKSPAFNFTLNIETSCPLPFGSHFRSIDGSCGHPKNLGAAFKPIARLLPPIYEDGVQVPRMYSVTGRPLPSPRIVSRVVHTDTDRATQFTIMLMQWGQIMDHDMVSTPLPIEDTRDTHVCCGPNKTLPLGNEDPECFPILFRGDDKFIGQCMEFVRSMPLQDSFGETMLPRQHMNAVTSFIDASTVYGSSDEVMRELRDKHGQGFLFRLDQGKPVDNGKEDCIKREGMNDYCYLAGDERVPWMPDEMVFQKVRAIMVAVTQKIMYNDWLPIILGEETVIQHGLYSKEPTLFDEEYNPSIFHAFSTAVFRFGHTLIPKEFFLGGHRREKLRDLFFKPYLMFEHFDEICINLVTGYDEEDRSQEFDRFITEEVTNHLFETQEGLMKGFDLIALNLQRARDHGLPAYNDYRELCGLHRIATFDDPVLGDAGRLFAGVYDHPDDIELFSGGISERSARGGLVGETFNCLMTKQFKALKYGDRYFFTHDRGTQGFSPPQLQEIQRYTLSHLMCETTKMREIQIDAFRKPGFDNPVVPCEKLLAESLNMEPFAFFWG